MQRYMLEAFFDALIALARVGAQGPVEISLPTRDFLWLAADAGMNDPRAMLRIAHDPRPLAFATATPSDTRELREVRIGDSFVLNGPTGPVTIKEHRNG